MTTLGPDPAIDTSDDARGEATDAPSVDGTDDGTDGIAALERIERDLAGVDLALARLDAGTYGRCEVCATPISDEVLADDALATVCAGHLAVLGPVGLDPQAGSQPDPR